MKLFKQVLGDEAQHSVFGGADAVALVTLADAVMLGLVRATASHHSPALPRQPVSCGLLSIQRTLGGQWGSGRVPAPPNHIHTNQLPPSVLDPVEPLHQMMQIGRPRRETMGGLTTDH